MGFDFGRLGAGLATGGLSELYYRTRNRGGGGYSPLPFENPNYAVDNSRIASEFQRVLGRAPTQNEVDNYARFIKTGDLSYDEIGQIIQGMPEFQSGLLERNTGALEGRLSQADAAAQQAVLSRAIPQVNAALAARGRQNSSAFESGLAQQLGQNALARDVSRQDMLARFYGGGLSGIADQYSQLSMDARSRGQRLQDDRTAYNRSLSGYQTQRNDYQTELDDYRRRQKQQQLQQFAGTVGGALVGGALGGGLPGARLGAGIGQQAGGLF